MDQQQGNQQPPMGAPQPQPQQPQPPMGAQPQPQQPQPPMGAQPQPQPQPQQPPMGAQPRPMYAPAPMMQLTGGMKFGWLAIGFCSVLPGILLAWLVNADKAPQVKSDAIKFAIIGAVIAVVILPILLFAISGCAVAMIAGSVGSYY